MRGTAGIETHPCCVVCVLRASPNCQVSLTRLLYSIFFPFIWLIPFFFVFLSLFGGLFFRIWLDRQYTWLLKSIHIYLFGRVPFCFFSCFPFPCRYYLFMLCVLWIRNRNHIDEVVQRIQGGMFLFFPFYYLFIYFFVSFGLFMTLIHAWRLSRLLDTSNRQNKVMYTDT